LSSKTSLAVLKHKKLKDEVKQLSFCGAPEKSPLNMFQIKMDSP